MWTAQKTLLSLVEWCEVIGINPWLVAQVGEPHEDLARVLGQCENVFYQNAAQSAGHLSREDIAQAIVQAEQSIADLLNTWIAPKAESYTVLYPRPANLRWRQLWDGTSGRLKSVRANYGNIQSMGVNVDTLVQAAVAVTPSNPYSDAFDTQWSLSVTVPTGTLASQVKVFFVSADIPAPYTRTDAEIAPVKVTISGTTATIQGQMTQLIKIANYLKLVPAPLNATDLIYATTVDVYTRIPDLNQSGALIWDNSGYCPDAPCEYSASSACFYATDAKGGYVAPLPAEFDATENEYVRLFPERYVAPDRVYLNLISGIPRDADGRVTQPLRQAVTYLSVGLFLQDKSCGCAMADNILFALRNQPINKDGIMEVSQQTMEAVSAKFGVVNRGTIKAYQLITTNQYLHVHRSVNW